MSNLVGKTALFYNKELVPHTTRVMVTKQLHDDEFIVSDFDDPNKIYSTGAWYFTVEKESEQPKEDILQKYIEAYEKMGA